MTGGCGERFSRFSWFAHHHKDITKTVAKLKICPSLCTQVPTYMNLEMCKSQIHRFEIGIHFRVLGLSYVKAPIMKQEATQEAGTIYTS